MGFSELLKSEDTDRRVGYHHFSPGIRLSSYHVTKAAALSALAAHVRRLVEQSDDREYRQTLIRVAARLQERALRASR